MNAAMTETAMCAGKRARYVLVTAAYNEEALIEKAIASVVGQTVPPDRWLIVSDSSTDRTDQIVQQYATRHRFLQLLRLNNYHRAGFGAKVRALNAGFGELRGSVYDFIGVLDADVTVGPLYFKTLLNRFNADPQLGLAGGMVQDLDGGRFRERIGNTARSVPGAVQLFRRGCHDAMGGFPPLQYGGEDWWAEITARMNGWRVEAFPDLLVHHHRATGTAGSLVRHWYRQGFMDFVLGSHPLFEIVKLTTRVPAKPFGLGALARLTGFAHAYFKREPTRVSAEFVSFLRADQRSRLLQLISRQIKGRPQMRANL